MSNCEKHRGPDFPEYPTSHARPTQGTGVSEFIDELMQEDSGLEADLNDARARVQRECGES